MKKINNNKGIVLTELVAYIVVTLVILSILGALMAYFRNNLNNVNTNTEYDLEFDKLNAQFVKETKTSNNIIDMDSSDENKVKFGQGNIYTYDSEDKAIYLNDNIKIAEHIEDAIFEVRIENGKQILYTAVTVGDKIRTQEYIVNAEELIDTEVQASTI